MAPENEPLSELTNPPAPSELHELPEYHDGEYADASCPLACASFKTPENFSAQACSTSRARA